MESVPLLTTSLSLGILSGEGTFRKMMTIIVILVISRKGDFIELYIRTSVISHQCLPGPCPVLCVARETVLVPGEFLTGKRLATRHHFLTEGS